MRTSCLLCAVVLTAASRLLAQDYEIRFERAYVEGQEYEITASGTDSNEMTWAAQGKESQTTVSSFAARLEGIVRVLEIDKLNQVKRLRLLVSAFWVSRNGSTNEVEVLPRWTHVMAESREGQKRFLVGDQPVSAETAEVLGAFISLSTTQTTDDDVFGSKGRKKVGDSWPVNCTNIVAGLSELGAVVVPDRCGGQAKVERLTVVDGVECLEISVRMDVDRVVTSSLRGLAAKDASVSASVSCSGEFPLDMSLNRLGEEETMRATAWAKVEPTADAPYDTVSMTTVLTARMRYRPIQPKHDW